MISCKRGTFGCPYLPFLTVARSELGSAGRGAFFNRKGRHGCTESNGLGDFSSNGAVPIPEAQFRCAASGIQSLCNPPENCIRRFGRILLRFSTRMLQGGFSWKWWNFGAPTEGVGVEGATISYAGVVGAFVEFFFELSRRFCAAMEWALPPWVVSFK